MNASELKPLTHEYLTGAVEIAPLFKQAEVSICCGWTKTLERKAKRVAVAAERLAPTQNYLLADKIAAMAASFKLDRKDLPVAVELADGRVALLSGHHRASAQLLNGASEIEVRLLHIVNGALTA